MFSENVSLHWQLYHLKNMFTEQIHWLLQFALLQQIAVALLGEIGNTFLSHSSFTAPFLLYLHILLHQWQTFTLNFKRCPYLIFSYNIIYYKTIKIISISMWLHCNLYHHCNLFCLHKINKYITMFLGWRGKKKSNWINLLTLAVSVMCFCVLLETTHVAKMLITM